MPPVGPPTAGRRRVVVAGTFDGLHEGHRDYFAQARRYGDDLVAIVARDATVELVKGRRALRSEGERCAAVAADPLVDSARLGNPGGSLFDVLQELRPDVVFLGYDQGVSEAALRAYLDAHGLSATAIRRGRPYKPDTFKSTRLDRRA